MVCVDTSPMVKWSVWQEEDYVDRALQVLHAHADARVTIAVPDLAVYELAEALVNRGFAEAAAVSAVDLLWSLGVSVEGLRRATIVEAIAFPKEYQTAVYDSVFAVVARSLGCPLLTADKRFYRRVAPLPWIHLLDYMQDISAYLD